jgi:FtsP/CotA-like multicopper oxidase with cupredoxin domain
MRLITRVVAGAIATGSMTYGDVLPTPDTFSSPAAAVSRAGALQLSLEGHHFDVVARDGHRMGHLERADTLSLSPGARIEALVTGGAPGIHFLRDGDVDTGPAGNRYAGTVMATVRVEGPAVTPVTLPPTLLPVEDLRPRVTNHRTIVYSESKDGETFFIDGRTFDMHRTDVRVTLGAIEEWTIRNDADELHSFHIHRPHSRSPR